MSSRSWRIAVIAVVLLSWAFAPVARGAGDELPDLDDTGVVVPWQDFKKILEEIRRPPPEPAFPPPPVDFALSECAAAAVVDPEEDQVRVTLGFMVQVLNGERWVQVPVIAEDLALESVTMDGAPARLYRSGGSHTLALRGIGLHRLQIAYLIPVQDSRGTRSARFRFPASPVVTLDLRIPRGDVDVEVGAGVLRSVARSAGETRVRAALRQARDTSVSWFTRLAADDKDSKVFGELATLVSVGEGVLRGSSTASYSIHGRGVDGFRLDLPADITVLDVSVHGLKGWRVEDGPDEGLRQLVVELSYLATGAFSFSFSFERLLEGGSVDLELPDIGLRDVLRERGFIAVAAATNVEITSREGLSNAAPVDPAELPPVLTAQAGDSVLYGYKYLRHPVVVPLSVVKHADVAVKRTMVELAELHSYLGPEGRMLSSARYTIRNNRKQYLEVSLPEGARLWGAYLEGRPVKAARRDDGAILVPLLKTARDPTGELRPFAVQVVYLEEGRRRFAVGGRDFIAPRLDVDVLEMRWRLDLPRDRIYFGYGGNLEQQPEANRVAVVGGAVYNLADADDSGKLAIRYREGKGYLSDGNFEVGVEDVRVQSGAKMRALTPEELAAIQGAPPSSSVAAPQAAGEDLGEVDVRRESAARDRAALGSLADQVAANVPQQVEDFQQLGAGRALGVLPVRISVPTDGLRLSFVGRLLTAGDPPTVSLRYAPAGWRLPKLGRFWTVLLAFSFGIVLLFLIGFGEPSAVRRIGMVTAAVALLVVLLMAPGHRIAFALACAAAIGVYALLAQLKDRQDVGGGF